MLNLRLDSSFGGIGLLIANREGPLTKTSVKQCQIGNLAFATGVDDAQPQRFQR